MDNNFTCLCMETVPSLEIEYQFDYNCKKINLKSENPGRMVYWNDCTYLIKMTKLSLTLRPVSKENTG